MRKIVEIIYIEKRHTSNGSEYYRTTVLDDRGDESVGWSNDRDEYQVGDKVMVFFDDRYNQAKCEKL